MSFVREEEGPLGNPSFLTLSLSCFLLFSSSNPLFLTLSLSCFLLFSLFFFSVSSSSPPSSSSSFRTTAPPFVVTPPWSSARPTRPDFVFFYHPFILLVDLAYNELMVILYFRIGLLRRPLCLKMSSSEKPKHG